MFAERIFLWEAPSAKAREQPIFVHRHGIGTVCDDFNCGGEITGQGVAGSKRHGSGNQSATWLSAPSATTLQSGNTLSSVSIIYKDVLQHTDIILFLACLPSTTGRGNHASQIKPIWFLWVSRNSTSELGKLVFGHGQPGFRAYSSIANVTWLGQQIFKVSLCPYLRWVIIGWCIACGTQFAFTQKAMEPKQSQWYMSSWLGNIKASGWQDVPKKSVAT